MTVRRVCMDCGSDLGEAPGYAPGETGVSHGLCDGCDEVRAARDAAVDQLFANAPRRAGRALIAATSGGEG